MNCRFRVRLCMNGIFTSFYAVFLRQFTPLYPNTHFVPFLSILLLFVAFFRPRMFFGWDRCSVHFYKLKCLSNAYRWMYILKNYSLFIISMSVIFIFIWVDCCNNRANISVKEMSAYCVHKLMLCRSAILCRMDCLSRNSGLFWHFLFIALPRSVCHRFSPLSHL